MYNPKNHIFHCLIKHERSETVHDSDSATCLEQKTAPTGSKSSVRTKRYGKHHQQHGCDESESEEEEGEEEETGKNATKRARDKGNVKFIFLCEGSYYAIIFLLYLWTYKRYLPKANRKLILQKLLIWNDYPIQRIIYKSIVSN